MKIVNPESFTLKARTTYVRADGETVHIAGQVVDGGYWWSIQGDWYAGNGNQAGYTVERGHYTKAPGPDSIVKESPFQGWWSDRVITDGSTPP